ATPRSPSGSDARPASIPSQTTRGFTGEEELSVGSLVPPNGRVYDSLIGRMISADPFVPDALNSQAWNRYSYVGNDPLAFTDPSGFSWLSQFFGGIKTFLQHNSLVAAVLKIAIAAVLTVALPAIGIVGVTAAVISATVSTAIVTGLSGGNLTAVLKGAAIAGATAWAFDFVGDVTLGAGHDMPAFGSPQHIANIAGHAAVGCGSAIA